MKLQLKHILGIPQLIVGIISLVALVFLCIYGTYPQELNVLYFQMACAATGSMGILVGMESIAFPSRDKRGIRNGLIFDLIISMVLGIAIIVTAINFANVSIGDIADPDIWEDTTLMFYDVSFYLGIIAGIILLFSMFLIGYMLYKDIKNK